MTNSLQIIQWALDSPKKILVVLLESKTKTWTIYLIQNQVTYTVLSIKQAKGKRKSGSLKNRRKNYTPRLLYCKDFGEDQKKEILKTVASQVHKQIHKQKEEVRIKDIISTKDRWKEYLKPLLEISPCAVSHYLDRMMSSYEEILRTLDLLELE